MVLLRAKVIVVGDSMVGKTAICQMLSSDGSVFPKNYALTVMSELVIKQVSLPDSGDTIEFFFMDCSGKGMYFETAKETWLNADMFCIVYDVTNKDSLNHVKFWVDKIKENFENKKPIGILIGNKCDLEKRRIIPATAAKQIAEQCQMKYFECSAKDYAGLLDPFKYLATQYLQKYKEKIANIKALID